MSLGPGPGIEEGVREERQEAKFIVYPVSSVISFGACQLPPHSLTHPSVPPPLAQPAVGL